jgi:hypothetical protein
VGGQRLELVRRGGEGQAGDGGDALGDLLGEADGAFRPVPTAVPPWASSISAGRVCSMRSMPFSTCWA